MPDQKSITVGSKSYDAMWAAINKSQAEQTPPPDAISSHEFARRFGLSRQCAEHRLSAAVRSGELETDVFRVNHGNGARLCRHYWPAKKKRKARGL